MSSTKTADSKRAPLLRAASFAKSFLKDWDRLSRAGRHDMYRLKEAMLLLIANDAPLGAEWLDHALTGEWRDHRECHIGGNFFLIYEVDDGGKYGAIVFVRVGTHADLFE